MNFFMHEVNTPPQHTSGSHLEGRDRALSLQHLLRLVLLVRKERALLVGREGRANVDQLVNAPQLRNLRPGMNSALAYFCRK